MGTSSTVPPLICFGKDHPHAYGDKVIIIDEGQLLTGSSPRVWGQDALTSGGMCLRRIIPTRMGTSGNGAVRIYPKEDHPHVYGDKSKGAERALAKLGSSPRVWGQVYRNMTLHAWRRIIPTRMGTRSRSPQMQRIRRDHPHAYGDKNSWQVFMTRQLGSSPRVWGQDKVFASGVTADGIIPTRMGTR